MLTKKIITLFVLVTGISGITIIDRIQSNQRSTDITNSKEIIDRQSKYTGIVAKVDKIAEQITVGIATPERDNSGSGVILARQGKTYYVATAGHVINKDEKYRIVAPDGKAYQLDNQNIIRSDAYDLAIFSFESDRDYTVATIGNYFVANNHDQAVFVSGFANFVGQRNPQRIITGGKVFNSESAVGLLYRNISYEGMNGGAILDRQGRLVGINTGADEQLSFEDDDYKNITIGFSLGIPIYEDILAFLTTQTQFQTKWLNINNNPAPEISENEWDSITEQLLIDNYPDDNRNFVAWMNYGNQLWRYEKYGYAIGVLEQATKINPESDRAYYTLGLIYWSMQSYHRAIEALETATKINPDIFFYWYLLGSSYGSQRDYEKAISAYERGIAINPQDHALYVELGLTLRTVRRYEEAIASIGRAIEINPDLPTLYNDRALTYTISQQYENALVDYDKAISLNPLFARAYNNRGGAYDDLQQYENALADFNQAIFLDLDYASPYRNRGNAYYSLGQHKNALADYNKAIAINPEFIDAYYSRIKLSTVLRKCEQVEADRKRLKEINPKVEIDNNCGKDHYSEKYDHAHEATRDLASILPEPEFAKSYKYRGDAYLELYQPSRALADYAQAISLNPNYVEAYRSRADFYGETGKVDLALADYNQIIAIDPQDIAAYWMRGKLNFMYIKGRFDSKARLENRETVLADLNKVIALAPESIYAAYAYEFRGYLYRDLEKTAEARKDWEKAASLYQQEGDMKQYHYIQELLKKL